MIEFEKIIDLIKKDNLVENFSPDLDHPDYGLYFRLGEVHEMGSGTGHFPKEGEVKTPNYNLIAKADGFSENRVLLEPGKIYALRSFEKINLPEDIFARLYSHGTMLASGISILGDMIEPGYEGNVRLVAVNNSDRTFQIDLESLFCKIIFLRVGSP